MWSYPTEYQLFSSFWHSIGIFVPVWSSIPVLLSVSTTKHALVLHTGLGHGGLLLVSFKECLVICFDLTDFNVI